MKFRIFREPTNPSRWRVTYGLDNLCFTLTWQAAMEYVEILIRNADHESNAWAV